MDCVMRLILKFVLVDVYQDINQERDAKKKRDGDRIIIYITNLKSLGS